MILDVTSIFGNNMDIVFFVYGLSFVLMGLAIALQLKEGSAFKWTKILWLLAAFGLTHGVNEWLDMWKVIKGENKTLALIGWFFLAGSYVVLFEFGRRVIRVSINDSPSCQLMAAKYMGWWLTVVAAGAVCFISIVYNDISKVGSAAARYILGFPGSLMAAYGFYSYYRCEKKMLSVINIKRYFIIMSAAFFLYSVFGGLVVSRGDFFPANVLNSALFLQITGIPVQVLRAGIALVLAFSMINILKIYNWEISNRQKEHLLRLQASEEKYKILIETIPDVVYMVDKDGIFIFINNAVRSLGYEPDELIGQHFSKILSPEDVDSVSRNAVLSKPLEKGGIPKLFDERRTGQRGTFGLEVHIVKKHEQTVPNSSTDIIVGEVNSSGVYEVNESSMEKEFAGTLGLIKTKQSYGSTGVIRDITIRKQEMEQLRKSEQMMEDVAQNLQQMVNEEIRNKLKREQLLVQQSKLATMGEMIAVVAHQWKQPLNIIGLIVQDLEDAFGYEGLDEEYIKKAVKSVLEQIAFMTKTVDDFRDFLRPSKEKMRFSIVKAIEDILFMNEALFKKGNIIVSFNRGNLSDNYEITGYTNEIKHVILNLVNNAKDAISNKKGEGIINISLSKDDNRIIIVITDNGGGIPPEIIERIFDPYFTTKPEQEGTGIGLYMSKTIIESRMSGKLTARNTSVGAEFRIELQAQ
ncbi:PAS domain-containing sensor histidine kinase [Candidatus Magnetominusculus xianensis]|uniref:histidine kinase n=1 Tax=Candidatus Magnetominusculus xianensis TaxID=1748249 RepID=A0ABR5SJY4_9BACT|nr:PAS domain-containing sensor histidine kinase [Candidatus Magnetominusculus xianensis]KWT95137.1 multi-sensor signal transduction histidine kinase [Candidatus Magnetominusculus xianensis]MBF0402784.1 PAS domain S-box protein [Nitrospirota bacterium]